MFGSVRLSFRVVVLLSLLLATKTQAGQVWLSRDEKVMSDLEELLEEGQDTVQ